MRKSFLQVCIFMIMFLFFTWLEATPPPSFQLLIPAHNNTLSSNTPRFTWQRQGDAIYYSLYISSDDAFQQNLITVDSIRTSLNTTTAYHDLDIENALEDLRWYYWKVRAYNATGEGTWSTGWNSSVDFRAFYMDAGVPENFSLTSPANNTEFTSSEGVILDWADAFPAPGANDDWGYQIFLATGLNMGNNQSLGTTQLSEFEIEADDLSDNTIFYWRILADNGQGGVTWSNELNWRFIINEVPERPDPFQLTTPTQNTIVNTLTPYFDWEAAVDPDPLATITYTLYIDTVQTFSAPTIIEDITPSDYEMVENLADNTTYYWKVLATDNTELTRWSSEIAIFHTNLYNEDPQAFNLIAPYNNSAVADATPLFQWQASSDPDPLDALEYTVQLAQDYEFTQMIDQFITGNTQFEPAESDSLPVQEIIYWRVQASDAEASVTSNQIWRFMINRDSTFQLLQPEMDEIVHDQTPQFQWEHFFGASSYEIIVASDSTFAYPEIEETVSTNQFTASSALTDNTVFYWKVRAFNAFEQIALAPIGGKRCFSVNLANDAPGSFSLLTPTNTDTIFSITPLFSWQKAVDADPGDTVEYELWYSEDANFTDYTVLATTSVQSFQTVIPSPFQHDHTYYWKVKASDDFGGETFSTAFSFYVNIYGQAPDDFALSSPANNAEIRTRRPLFQWQAANDPDGENSEIRYTIQLSEDTFFDAPFFEVENLIDTEYQFPQYLHDNQIFYWRVIASDAQTNETIAGPFSFAVNVHEEMPLDFHLLSPRDTSEVATVTPTLRWQGSSDLDPLDSLVYTVYLDTTSSFSNPVQFSALSDTVWVISSPLQENQQYFWKVKAESQDSTDFTWAIEQNWQFLVNAVNQAPNEFALISPAAGAALAQNSIAFNWQDAEDPENQAVTYVLYWSTDAQFAADVDSVTNISSSELNMTINVQDQEIYWKVFAIDSRGKRRQSAIRQFRIDTLAPELSGVVVPGFGFHNSFTLSVFTNESLGSSPEATISYGSHSEALTLAAVDNTGLLWSTSFTIPDQQNLNANIAVAATDVVGNSGSSTVSVLTYRLLTKADSTVLGGDQFIFEPDQQGRVLAIRNNQSIIIQSEQCSVVWKSGQPGWCLFREDAFFAHDSAQLPSGHYQMIRDEQPPVVLSWQINGSILHMDVEEETQLVGAILQQGATSFYGKINAGEIDWNLPVNYCGDLLVKLIDAAGNETEQCLFVETASILPQVTSPTLQTFPNPANPEVTITFALPDDVQPLQLKIYNVKGQCVQTWDDLNRAPVRWDGVNRDGDAVASGVYFVQLQHSHGVLNKKMLLLK